MNEQLLFAPLVPVMGILLVTYTYSIYTAAPGGVFPSDISGEELPLSSLLSLKPRITVWEHLCMFAGDHQT